MVSCKSTSKSDADHHQSSLKSDITWATFANKTMWWVYIDSSTMSLNDESKTFFQNWTADSSGFGFRQPYIQFFTDGNNGSKFLTGIRKKDILELMGKPDRQNSGKGYITVVNYFMESGCGNPEYDCSWLTIYFDKNDRATDVSVACT
jgi:hypothetical protein